jgi:hypothetical protein
MLERAVAAATLVAFFVAVPAAVTQRHLRPLAALVLLAFIGNPIRSALTADLFATQEAMRAAGLDPMVAPLVGVARVEGHAMQALVASWAPAVAGMVALLFGQRAWPVLVLWLGADLRFWLGYHELRGDGAAQVFFAVDLAAVLFLAASVVPPVVQMTRARRMPHPEQWAGLALGLFEWVRLLHYYRGPWATYDVARVPLLCEFLSIIVFCGGCLCLRSRSRSALESR